MSVMISVKNLVKKYNIYQKPIDRLKETLSLTHKVYHKEFCALNGLSFEVEKGEAIGILGKNGSGKSTLLKMITGVLTPTEGSITINGKIAAILELGTGFNQEYTGIENIYLNGTMMGYTREEMEEKVNSVVEFADIGEFINQPVKVYSSGMFARLAFAVAINVDPDILIVDEALAVGDTRFQIKCINKMKELKEKGTTILFVSHATEQVKRFCNRAMWIRDGKIVEIGDSSEIGDMYEEFMKYGETDNSNDVRMQDNDSISEQVVHDGEIADFRMPNNPDVLASIMQVKINRSQLKTFDDLIVEVTYDIYREDIDGFLLGVAINTPDGEYIFGPNTYLDKAEVPNTMGRHKVLYKIPSMTLLGGNYLIDVGIFNNEGIVGLDYKQAICDFKVVNKYISEGKFYINHEWEVIQ